MRVRMMDKEVKRARDNDPGSSIFTRGLYGGL